MSTRVTFDVDGGSEGYTTATTLVLALRTQSVGSDGTGEIPVSFRRTVVHFQVERLSWNECGSQMIRPLTHKREQFFASGQAR